MSTIDVVIVLIAVAIAGSVIISIVQGLARWAVRIVVAGLVVVAVLYGLQITSAGDSRLTGLVFLAKDNIDASKLRVMEYAHDVKEFVTQVQQASGLNQSSVVLGR